MSEFVLKERIERLEQKNADLRARLEQATGLLRSAKCPNYPKCDSNGTIFPDGESVEPCQWCHKRDTFLRGD